MPGGREDTLADADRVNMQSPTGTTGTAIIASFLLTAPGKLAAIATFTMMAAGEPEKAGMATKTAGMMKKGCRHDENGNWQPRA